MKKVRLVSEKQVDVGGRSRLRKVVYEFEDGATQGYDLYDLRASMQHSAGVLPVDAAGNVYLVEEFLPALGTWGLSLARGGIEPGEEPMAAAMRELQEEAGLACERLEPLWQGYVMPNGSSWQVHLFVGRGVEAIEKKGGDEVSGTRTVKMPLAEAKRRVKAGEMPGSLLALAIMLVDA